MDAELKKTANGKSARNRQGIMTGIVGMTLNVLLGLGKLVAGILSGSVTVTADAANNLSDVASGGAAVASFYLSGKKASKKRPYGYGRAEYIAGFVIGIIVLIIGVQFAISSVEAIISPKVSKGGALSITILSVSIAVKLFMFFFYTYRAKKIRSSALKAAAADSLSDSLMTLVALASVITSMLSSFLYTDGIFGTVVSLAVIYGGINILRSTIGRLLGSGANEALEKKIEEIVCENPLIIGMHDLNLHDYGPEKRIASCHAEFDANITIVEAHRIIDYAETRALKELAVELVIHVDPVDTSSPLLLKARKAIKEVLVFYHGSTFHELHITPPDKSAGGAANTVAFDVRLPVKYEKLEDDIRRQLFFELKKVPELINGGNPPEIAIGFDILPTAEEN